MNILAILYYLVSFFYLFSALALLFFPEKMKRFLRPLFPLLESFHPSFIASTVCLAMVGVALYLVGRELTGHSLWGLYFAFVFSVWEVFLAFKFYLPRRERLNAIGHFALHTLLAVVIANIIVLGYSLQINGLLAQFTGSSQNMLAAVGAIVLKVQQ